LPENIKVGAWRVSEEFPFICMPCISKPLSAKGVFWDFFEFVNHLIDEHDFPQQRLTEWVRSK